MDDLDKQIQWNGRSKGHLGVDLGVNQNEEEETGYK
jgi:hypothetical protein